MYTVNFRLPIKGLDQINEWSANRRIIEQTLHKFHWKIQSSLLYYTPCTGRGERRRYSDSLGVGRSGNRISVGTRFSASAQTGPGAYSSSFTIRTGSFPGVKRKERGVDHPPPPSSEVKERIKLYLCPSSGPAWLILGWTGAGKL